MRKNFQQQRIALITDLHEISALISTLFSVSLILHETTISLFIIIH